MVKIIIPSILRRFMEGSKICVSLSGKTVAEAMSILLGENEKSATHIIDDKGNLRNFVNLFLNNEEIRHLQGQNTNVGEKDTIRL